MEPENGVRQAELAHAPPLLGCFGLVDFKNSEQFGQRQTRLDKTAVNVDIGGADGSYAISPVTASPTSTPPERGRKTQAASVNHLNLTNTATELDAHRLLCMSENCKQNKKTRLCLRSLARKLAEQMVASHT